MPRIRDQFTVDMFTLPEVPAANSASMMYAAEVSTVLASMFQGSGQERQDIADEMSRIIGKPVSKYMLDAWTSESRAAYNVPFYAIPAAEAACQSHIMSTWLADKRGGRLLVGQEAIAAEYGKLKSLQNDVKQKMRQLERLMGGAA